VAVNSFGIGWWWLNNDLAATLTTTTTTKFVHVPHPEHHIEENRKLPDEMLLRIQSIVKQQPRDDEIDNRHHKDLEAGDKPKRNQNKIDLGYLKKVEEEEKAELSRAEFWELRKQYIGAPVSVNASPKKRLHEVRGSRFDIGVYDADMHGHKYHHMGDRVDQNERLLGHWYDYVFFEDWKEDL